MARPTTMRASLPRFWGLLQHFWPRVRPHKGLLAGSTAALLAEVALRLLEPWPIKLVFDHVLAPVAGAGLPSLRLSAGELLVLTALAVVVLGALRALAAYSSAVGFTLVGNRVISEVRADLYHHLQRLPLAFHHRERTGDLVIRVISDVGVLKEAVITAALPLLTHLLVLVGMLGMMFWLDWRLAVLSFGLLPLFWLRTMRLSVRIQKVSRDQRRREGDLAATAAESIGAIKVVQAQSLEGVFARSFAVFNQKSLHEGAKSKRLEAGMERGVDVFIAASTALVLGYGARLVLQGDLTPGDLLVFLAYQKNAFRPVRDFAKYTARLAKATAAGERVLDIMQREPEVQDHPGAVPAPPLHGHVRFEDVGFAYENGHEVFRSLSFEVPPGHRVALVGPSGIGKSTVVSLLLRLYDPVRGRITVDGRDIREFTLSSLRAQVGLVLQDHLLFATTVRENIACGAPGATDAEVEAAAQLAGAHSFIQALPQGYDTVLGERGMTLSNGQRQRLALARAAVRRSPILVFDEPTTGLDEEAERVVVSAIERLAVGRTTLLITHDLHLAARADTVFVLAGGKILESGSPTELLRAGGTFARMYGDSIGHIRDGERRPDALIA